MFSRGLNKNIIDTATVDYPIEGQETDDSSVKIEEEQNVICNTGLNNMYENDGPIDLADDSVF